MVAATSAQAVTTLAGADVINVTGDTTVAQMNSLLNESQYSNIGSYSLTDSVENLLAGGDIVANAEAAAVSGEPMLTVAQYNEIAAVATVETYTVEDTAEAILEAGADAAALTGAASVAITDETVTLEQAVALDTLDLGVAYPAVDVSLEAAAAAETLPTNYTLTADVFAADEVTVEAATAAFGAVSDIVAGAANADELAVADLFTWSIADTLANIDAADADVIEGADAYTLTNEAGELGELTGDEYETVLGAANADDYTYTVVPSPITGISAEGPVVEGNEIAFTVEMDYAVNVERVISYNIEGAEAGTAGAADALADLGLITGTVTIPVGEKTGTITLTPVQDSVTEGREAFTVTLLSEDGTEVVATSNTVVIEDQANAGQNTTLTTDIDEEAGGAGNDTFRGLIDTSTAANSTLNALDSIDGLGGTDTLRLNVQGTDILGNTAASGTAAFPTANISNVENLLLRSGAEVNLDLTAVNWEGLELVNVERADGGTDVTVNATADTGDGSAQVVSGTIDIGQTNLNGDEEPSGAINVTQTLESDGAGTENTSDGNDLEGGDITVTGGTTVDVTVNANSVAEADDSNFDIAIGTVDINAGDDTTDVTVTQNDNSQTFTSETVEAVAATQSLTFGALDDGQTTTVGGLTFTASQDLTAEQVAAAFANLTSEDTQTDGGPVENGIFTGALGTAGWTSGEADGDTVVFTAPSSNPGALTFTNGDVDPTSDYEAGTAASGGTESSNAVSYGNVDVDDNGTASVRNITLNGYNTATLGGGTSLNALETLSLTNGAAGGTTLHTTQTSLDVTVNNVNGNISLDGTAATISDLTLTATGDDSVFDLTAAAVENLTIDAEVDLDLDGSTIGSGNDLATVDINGAGSVDLGTVQSSTSLDSFNAADNTGGVTATVDANSANVGDITEYVFSAGNDSVTLNDTTVDVAVSLGAGNDTVTLASGTTALGAMVDGGEGDADTLHMDAANAVTASAGTAFEQNIQNFERLSLGQAAADGTVNLANMDDINYVRTAGSNANNVASTTWVGAVSDLTQNDTIQFTYNGTQQIATIGSIAGTTATAAEVQTAINTSLEANGANAGDVSVSFTNSNADLTLSAAGDRVNDTLTGETYSDADGDNDIAEGTDTAADIDVLTLDNLAADATVELTANGTVEAVLEDATGASDSLNVVVSATTADVDAGTLTVADVETVNITSSDNQLDNTGNGTNDAVETNTLDLNADSATSVVVDGNANLTLDVAGSADVTTIDAGAMTGALTVTATGDAAMTVNGGSGADNLTASGNGDVLNGGDGNDTLTGANQTELTGGAGADTFVMNTPSNVNNYSTIMDLDSGDVIDFADGSVFVSSEVTLGNTAVFQDYANATVKDLDDNGNDVAWFRYDDGAGVDTYIIQSGDAAADDFENGTDSIIKIEGDVDLSTASYNQTDGTIEIA